MQPPPPTAPARVRRVAVLGAGMISFKHLTAWKTVTGAEVVAVVDPDAGRAAARAAEFSIPHHYPSFASLLSEQAIDAVDIASSRDSHGPLLREAMQRCIPAICEKPLMPSVADAEQLVGDARNRSRIMVNQNFRFRPYFQLMKQWIDEGLVGELTSCTIDCRSSGLLRNANGNYPYIERQPFVRREPRMMIEEVLIHRIDIARWLCGPLRLLAARTLHSCPELLGESEASIFLAAGARGFPVVVDGNFASAGYPALSQDRVEIIGDRSRILMEANVLRLIGPRMSVHEFEPVGSIQQSFNASMQHFIDCLQTGEPFLTDAEENLETLRLIDAAYAAAS